MRTPRPIFAAMTLRRFASLPALIATLIALALFPLQASAQDEEAAPAEGEVLSLYIWPNYMPPDLLRRFTEETGIRVDLDIYDSNEKMIERIADPDHGYDLVVPGDYAVELMIKTDMAEPMNVADMANVANIAAPHDAPPYDPAREFSAPYLWGTVGFSYDQSALGDFKPQDSWSMLFEVPEALKGKVGMLDDEVEVFAAAAFYLGLDPCTADEEEQTRIFNLLQRQAPNVATYDSNATITRLMSGAVGAQMQWNTSAHKVRRSLPGVTYVYPIEGLNWWQDNFVIPKGAKNAEAARTFVNWMLDPKNAAAASNFTGYMNTVKGSAELMDKVLREDDAVNMPELYASRLRSVPVCAPEVQAKRHELWTQLRAGE
ncbi:extracellular solute-binding protein [Tepidamorphus sp. 3E244]|uniref:extracellular solute-binding protein n=1 Tax=Tepidamorphus sp. 3E244 TaxID=3385498 RepID=UPI0038FCDE51